MNRGLLKRVMPEVRELYHMLEVQFHPHSISKKIANVMAKIANDPEMAKYVKPLYKVILTRLLQQVEPNLCYVFLFDSCRKFTPPLNWTRSSS